LVDLLPRGALFSIDSPDGHDGFLIAVETLERGVRAFRDRHDGAGPKPSGLDRSSSDPISDGGGVPCAS
ncbi:MAG: hypothetical protein AAGN46_07320, partial [Acidobacteriota bacterium]